MSTNITETLASIGWEFEDSIPLTNKQEELIGELYSFTKNGERLDVFHYFFEQD